MITASFANTPSEARCIFRIPAKTLACFQPFLESLDLLVLLDQAKCTEIKEKVIRWE
jgi:hypothetical protein